jgi:hypothetical protein
MIWWLSVGVYKGIHRRGFFAGVVFGSIGDVAIFFVQFMKSNEGASSMPTNFR